MALRKRFPHRGQSSPPRINKWAIGPSETTPMILGTTANQLWSTGVTLNVPQVTIVRLRGELEIFMLSNTSVGDGFAGAVGLCLVRSAHANLNVK